ncbi:hypothetical protein FE251_06750 [Georgenia wutianyii]|uniref:Swt1-like HEPN domain-containing protein n=1 Tax=Georgenia wutianyii TaxID=2585135 RepID=A0ABX5VMS8_9MICO|nr:hypothetical protein [Georgenia wutianyii]QDB79101.1 hypothetical protein FE251_06750 [Georgenia wutianyii]
MDPTAALRSIESVLRAAIHRVFDGEDWLDTKGAPTRESLTAKRAEEEKRRDGVLTSQDLLEYVETYHLTRIVLNSWELFKPIFDDKKRTETYFGLVDDVRNSIAHSRDLVPYEEDLLSGVAQHLSNQLSLYGTAGNPAARYYPSIERVVDSLGSAGSIDESGTIVRAPRLEVGQVLRFRGRAVSARGKQVTWYLSRPIELGVGSVEWEMHDGLSLDYEWTVTEREVGEARIYAVLLVSESRYHRHPPSYFTDRAFDDVRHFQYSVNPPLEEPLP